MSTMLLPAKRLMIRQSEHSCLTCGLGRSFNIRFCGRTGHYVIDARCLGLSGETAIVARGVLPSATVGPSARCPRGWGA